MKKFTALAATAILVTSLLPSMAEARAYVVGSASKVNVYVNSQLLQLDQPAIIKNGRTLVPFRAVLEALGATIKWDEATRTVHATKGDIELALPLGSTTAIVNDQSVTIDVPAEQINYRTMVPLRLFAEAYGADIGWAGRTASVFVSEYSDEASEALQTYIIDSNDEYEALDQVRAKANRSFLDFSEKKITYAEYQSVNEAQIAEYRTCLESLKAVPVPLHPVSQAYASRQNQIFSLTLEGMVTRGKVLDGDQSNQTALKAYVSLTEELAADWEAFRVEFEYDK